MIDFQLFVNTSILPHLRPDTLEETCLFPASPVNWRRYSPGISHIATDLTNREWWLAKNRWCNTNGGEAVSEFSSEEPKA